jgi:hypothetical protein
MASAQSPNAECGVCALEFERQFLAIHSSRSPRPRPTTDLELIFTMLGEASTTEIAQRKDAQGFHQNRIAAKEGGTVAGNARKELEAKSGRPVVSNTNYLTPLESSASEEAAIEQRKSGSKALEKKQ